MPIRLALNRTCAPQLSLADVIALARQAGVEAVEIRNDIEGQEFHDGTPAAEVKARLDEAGLAVASVNALQRFNEWSPTRAKEAEAIIAFASALGAPGVVLCPVHKEDHGWTEAEAEMNLRERLLQLRPILMAHGLTGYVGPLGNATRPERPDALDRPHSGNTTFDARNAARMKTDNLWEAASPHCRR